MQIWMFGDKLPQDMLNMKSCWGNFLEQHEVHWPLFLRSSLSMSPCHRGMRSPCRVMPTAYSSNASVLQEEEEGPKIASWTATHHSYWYCCVRALCCCHVGVSSIAFMVES